MKLTSCRVQNYRSIKDSGWVDIDDIAVIVGKNESGKTSFLKALWKFNPFTEEPYDINREWPRGRRKDRGPNKTVVDTKFDFSAEEITAIEAVHESAKGITGVQISRDYSGNFHHEFHPVSPNTEHSISWVVDLLENLSEPLQPFSDHFKSNFKSIIDPLITEVRSDEGTEIALSKLPAIKEELASFRHPNQPQYKEDNNHIPALKDALDKTIDQLKRTPLLNAVDLVHQWLPVFVYMDDYRTFKGSAQLDEVQKRKSEKHLTPDDETIIVILEMSGLSLEDEVKKAAENDREQRILDMNDASQSLTNEISERWTQSKYEVMFQADGHHFITFVKGINDKVLVPLEERSRGFQWFFSFDMLLMYETKGNFSNAIILLDEPGLHLHAAAQQDLLSRMKDYAENNQLIYSTHLPFMIDFTRLDNINVAEEIVNSGTVLHKNWATADEDARFTLQAALGLSWSQSLFVGQYNLVVEGVDDYWLLTVFSTLFEEADQAGIDSDLVITPAGGASKVAYVGTILTGQKLNVAAMLDSDPAGRQAFDQLVHNWIITDNMVLMIGKVIGKQPCAIEDLFSESYYLAKANESYQKELSGTPISLDSKTQGKKPIVDRIKDAFASRDLGEYNKGRAAKRIMKELGNTDLKKVDTEAVTNFRKLIDAINMLAASWKKA